MLTDAEQFAKENGLPTKMIKDGTLPQPPGPGAALKYRKYLYFC